MSTMTRWTSADLEDLPDDGNLYEIIAGELYMSTQPHFYHQFVCCRFVSQLDRWNEEAGLGEGAPPPRLLFAGGDEVAPDLVCVRNYRPAAALRPVGQTPSA